MRPALRPHAGIANAVLLPLLLLLALALVAERARDQRFSWWQTGFGLAAEDGREALGGPREARAEAMGAAPAAAPGAGTRTRRASRLRMIHVGRTGGGTAWKFLQSSSPRRAQRRARGGAGGAEPRLRAPKWKRSPRARAGRALAMRKEKGGIFQVHIEPVGREEVRARAPDSTPAVGAHASPSSGR